MSVLLRWAGSLGETHFGWQPGHPCELPDCSEHARYICDHDDAQGRCGLEVCGAHSVELLKGYSAQHLCVHHASHQRA